LHLQFSAEPEETLDSADSTFPFQNVAVQGHGFDMGEVVDLGLSFLSAVCLPVLSCFVNPELRQRYNLVSVLIPESC
jgi:hypothetical protein